MEANLKFSFSLVVGIFVLLGCANNSMSSKMQSSINDKKSSSLLNYELYSNTQPSKNLNDTNYLESSFLNNDSNNSNKSVKFDEEKGKENYKLIKEIFNRYVYIDKKSILKSVNIISCLGISKNAFDIVNSLYMDKIIKFKNAHSLLIFWACCLRSSQEDNFVYKLNSRGVPIYQYQNLAASVAFLITGISLFTNNPFLEDNSYFQTIIVSLLLILSNVMGLIDWVKVYFDPANNRQG